MLKKNWDASEYIVGFMIFCSFVSICYFQNNMSTIPFTFTHERVLFDFGYVPWYQRVPEKYLNCHSLMYIPTIMYFISRFILRSSRLIKKLFIGFELEVIEGLGKKILATIYNRAQELVKCAFYISEFFALILSQSVLKRWVEESKHWSAFIHHLHLLREKITEFRQTGEKR